jgi:hypothetical protein
MKRLTLIIFTLALCVGVFAPVTGAVMSGGEVAVSVSTVLAQTTSKIDVQLAVDPGEHIEACGFSSPPACIAWVTYYIPYSIGEWFMGIAARTFDVAATLTLSSKLYTSGSFLQAGWQVTRDFANIFFILILLFIALSLTLDIEIGHANPKKMLASLVMVALVINFSFFITEVVIDLSNSLALVFYNQVTVIAKATDGTPIDISDQQLNDQLKQATGTDVNGKSVQYIQTEKPLSLALVQAMKPQILSDSTFYDKLCGAEVHGFYGTPVAVATCKTKTSSGILISLFLLVGIMFIVTGYCFVVALASLFGRMVGLFINIVFAPIAFVSLIVPKMKEISGFGWDEWISSLMTNAFAAPIFFFFILLISILSKSSIVPTKTATLSPGIILLLVTIQFIILITMLLKATAYVKKASGQIGNAMGGLAGGLVKGLGGLALGTAGGVVAIAGSKTIGAAGNKLAGSEWATKLATSKYSAIRGFGRKTVELGQGASKASFNPNAGLAAITGLNVDSFGALSQKRSAGGFQARTAYQTKKDTDFANSLQNNQAEAKAIKELKEKREGEVANLEGKLFKKEAAEKELKQARQNHKDALEDKKRTADFPDGDERKVAAMQRLAAAEEKLFGKRGDDGKLVLKADGTTEKEGLETGSETLRTEIAAIKNQIQEQKNGKVDDEGKQVKYTEDDVDKVKKADGTLVTKADVKEGEERVRAEGLSIKDLENLMESNKKANTKAYLYQQARWSGHHVAGEFDKLGNVKGFHVDPNGAGDSQWGKAIARGIGKASVGAAIGFAVAGPIGVAMAAGFGGLSQAVVEAYNVGMGNKVGASYGAAVVAAGTSHEAHGGHDAHGDHGHGGGVLAGFRDTIMSAFKGLGAGGGGGGKPSGGGGHH